MDLQVLREEAIKFKKKAQQVGKQVLSASTEKLVESRYTLETLDDIKKCIAKSKTTT